jgi:hypothetical protein
MHDRKRAAAVIFVPPRLVRRDVQVAVAVQIGSDRASHFGSRNSMRCQVSIAVVVLEPGVSMHGVQVSVAVKIDQTREYAAMLEQLDSKASYSALSARGYGSFTGHGLLHSPGRYQDKVHVVTVDTRPVRHLL